MGKFKNEQSSNGSKRNKYSKYKKNLGSIAEGRSLTQFQKDAIRKRYLSSHGKNQKGNSSDAEDQSHEEDPYSKFKEDRSAFDALPSKNTKLSRFQKARREFDMKRKEKEAKKEELEQRKEEIEEKRKNYKEKKFQRFKKLNQKTKWGQPVMRGRMELLYEDIKAVMGKKEG